MTTGTTTSNLPAAPTEQHAKRRRWHVPAPALLKSSRGTARRLLFRSPILLYRLGLGRLLGHEFLLLTHAGRRTGRVHQTVLKVLRYDPETGESVVVSAWGSKADWYRNIQARPALEVCAGRDWYVPEQRCLPADEAFAVFERWTQREPRFARLMLGQIGLSLDGPEAERRAAVTSFPFVGLRPQRTAGRKAT